MLSKDHHTFRGPSALRAALGTAVGVHAGSAPLVLGSSAQPSPNRAAACPLPGGFLTQPDPCARSQGRQEVKTTGKSESRPHPLTDANCGLSVNFKESKISSVLLRVAVGEAARYAQGETQPYQLSKEATEILHCLYRDDTEHMCSDLLSGPFLFLFTAVARRNHPANSCCQRGRLGGLSRARCEIIQVGALSSALKFLLLFQFPVPVLSLLP